MYYEGETYEIVNPSSNKFNESLRGSHVNSVVHIKQDSCRVLVGALLNYVTVNGTHHARIIIIIMTLHVPADH